MFDSISNLPYFDVIINGIESGNPEVKKCLGQHVHWGYWDDPTCADGTIDDFVSAADRMCEVLFDAGEIKDDLRVIDVGCGFGGTIDSLNKKYSNLRITGINIDERQLAIAQENVEPCNGNNISFVQGDACRLPLEDNSVDVLLAVECIFHFSDKIAFFKEVSRVLKKGGKFAMSDFVPDREKLYFIDGRRKIVKKMIKLFFGRAGIEFTVGEYKKIAESAGFKSSMERDITENTLPTYYVLKKLFSSLKRFSIIPNLTMSMIEWGQRSGHSRYAVLGFEKQ